MNLIKELTEDVSYLKEGNEDGSKSYFIEGIIMQSNIKNKNGRVYPKNVLMKEMARYNELYVKENRAHGELGHPCFLETAEILTTDGWKGIAEIDGDEKVYTRKNGRTEIHTIKTHVVNDFSGNMLRLKNRGIDTTVTPDHRFLVVNQRTNEEKFVTARQIEDHLSGKEYISDTNISKWYIPKGNEGLPETREKYTIKGSNTLKFVSDKTRHLLEDVDIDMATFSKFMGLYLAEGCTTVCNNKYKVSVFQNEGDKADIIRDLVNDMNQFNWHEYSSNGKLMWSCHDRRLGEYLHGLGNCYNKYVPRDLMDSFGKESAKGFLDYFVLGDGRGTFDEKYVRCDMFSTSEQLIDDCTQILSIAGYASNKVMEICENDYVFADRVISKANKKPLYFAKVIQSKGVYLDPRFLKIEKVPYEGKVYCIQVENQTFIARDNGYSFWSGNCNPSINLDRVSHRFISLEEDGDNVVGKAKILTSQPMGQIVKNFIDEGSKLGISSRGLGSLKKNSQGFMEVQEDFMLATAGDIVADPSAPNAFVRGVMENVEWVYDVATSSWTVQNEFDRIEEEIKETAKVSRKELEEKASRLFEQFIKSL